ncbi:MAG: hypothetical protein V7L23_26735 [Nostoc sp.]|uniref:hypothetical protein n=1 Tax=Nostoc sp. TaxID=1180 RepID=UPI002FF29C53
MSDYTKLRAISEEDTNSVDELEASSTETEISSTEGLELKSEPLKIEQGVDSPDFSRDVEKGIGSR